MDKIAPTLATLGLLDKAYHKAGSLAHGEMQWLEIGMVIVQEPALFLLDEPVAGMTKDEREHLRRATREVWALHVRGKVFVLGKDIKEDWRRAAKRDGIRHAGGLVQDEASPSCDYFVTNDQEEAELARRAGAKRVIDTLVQQVLTMERDY